MTGCQSLWPARSATVSGAACCAARPATGAGRQRAVTDTAPAGSPPCPTHRAPLPPTLFPAAARRCHADEPKRYTALVRHLQQQWQRDRQELGVAAAAEATLPFVPLAKW